MEQIPHLAGESHAAKLKIETEQQNEFNTFVFMNYLRCQIAVISTFSALFLNGCISQDRENAHVDRFIPSSSGARMNLVGMYKPLHIYIYANTNLTNQAPEYAIFEGHEPIFMRENWPSNTVSLTHYENGLSVLTTKRDKNERVLKRNMDIYDTQSVNPMIHNFYYPEYVYFDLDGDGLWDRLLLLNDKQLYVRSNLCWVLISKSKGGSAK